MDLLHENIYEGSNFFLKITFYEKPSSVFHSILAIIGV